jgi:SSS family solute:Na+ symporter
VFTARSEGVARYAGTVAGLYCIVYGLMCAAIGMATKVLLPDLAVPANAFASMVKDGLPDGVRAW